MDALSLIINKYNLDISKATPQSPVEIPNVNRHTLAQWFNELDFKIGVELGVDAGEYSEMICKFAPKLELHCVDAWQMYPEYTDSLNEPGIEAKYTMAKNRLAPYNAKIVRAFSDKAVNLYPDNSLDFVYIDANHELPFCMWDIIMWEQKVRPGGIVTGHDYIRFRRSKAFKCEVIEATHWFTYLRNISPWFILGTRRKVVGELRDDSRSWMWVKK